MKQSVTISYIVVFKKINLFIYGCTGSLLLHMGFLLIVVSRGYSLVAVHEFLIAEASLVGKHRF